MCEFVCSTHESRLNQIWKICGEVGPSLIIIIITPLLPWTQSSVCTYSLMPVCMFLASSHGLFVAPFICIMWESTIDLKEQSPIHRHTSMCACVCARYRFGCPHTRPLWMTTLCVIEAQRRRRRRRWRMPCSRTTHIEAQYKFTFDE